MIMEEKILKALTEIQSVLDSVKRGMYGDPANRNHIGLIEEVDALRKEMRTYKQEQDLRLKKLEKLKEKIVWMGMGASGVIVVFVEIVHWLIN